MEGRSLEVKTSHYDSGLVQTRAHPRLGTWGNAAISGSHSPFGLGTVCDLGRVLGLPYGDRTTEQWAGNKKYLVVLVPIFSPLI